MPRQVPPCIAHHSAVLLLKLTSSGLSILFLSINHHIRNYWTSRMAPAVQSRNSLSIKRHTHSHTYTLPHAHAQKGQTAACELYNVTAPLWNLSSPNTHTHSSKCVGWQPELSVGPAAPAKQEVLRRWEGLCKPLGLNVHVQKAKACLTSLH